MTRIYYLIDGRITSSAPDVADDRDREDAVIVWPDGGVLVIPDDRRPLRPIDRRTD